MAAHAFPWGTPNSSRCWWTAGGARHSQQSLAGSRAMKLSSARVERTLSQIEAQALPDNHPSIPKLNELFGEHTFFLDRNGLNIVEADESDSTGGPTGKIVKVASWTDEENLKTHEPEPTDMVILLGPEH